jgi:8-oxo-dGTP pyrophosphatase MutT (NUDIX family)
MTGYVREMRKLIGHDTLMIVAAGIYVYKDGKILLQRRKDNDCWSDHGGSVELGETLEEAAARELFEETGLKALKLELFGVFSGPTMYFTYPNGDKVYIVDVCFVCEEFSGSLKCQKSEVTELKWFEIDNIPENITPPVKMPMARFIEFIKNRKK